MCTILSNRNAAIYLSIMRRRAIIGILLTLFLIQSAGPAFELVDRWDNFPQSGSDTLHTLIALATLLGAIFVLAGHTSATIGSLRFISILQAAIKPGRSDRLSFETIRPDSLPAPGLSALRI